MKLYDSKNLSHLRVGENEASPTCIVDHRWCSALLVDLNSFIQVLLSKTQNTRYLLLSVIVY